MTGPTDHTHGASEPPLAGTRPRRKLSRRRRVCFSLVTVAIVYAACEGICLFSISFLGHATSLAMVRGQQASLAETGRATGDAAEVIHPYTGWAFNPQISPGITHNGRIVPVNRLGLVDDGPGLLKRSPDRLIVGIAGGSVAWQASVDGEDVIRNALESAPQYRGRDVELVRMALPGYKQPQQVMTLAWQLALGAEFDIVINVDGYNESVLPICENRNGLVNTAYPRSWDVRTLDMIDPRRSATSFEIMQLRAGRQRLAQNAVRSFFRWSPAYHLIWAFRDGQFNERKLALETEVQIARRLPGGRGFANVGPPETFTNDDELHAAVVALWLRSSRQMHRLCSANGIRYIQVLQPNQYVPDSKPLSETERRKYHSPGMEAAGVVRTMYPRLVEGGTQLRSEGVDFLDLTQLFSDSPQTLYSDYWCHYNAEGNQMLASAIVRHLLETGSSTTE